MPKADEGLFPRRGMFMTRFADPLWFALALLVIARIALLVRDRRARVGAFGFSALSLVAPGRSIRARTSGIPFFLEIVALLLLIVALARPQRTVAAPQREIGRAHV